jgi:WD40 repeat protein
VATAILVKPIALSSLSFTTVRVGCAGTIDIWDTKTYDELFTLGGHDTDRQVYSLAFSPDSRWLASGSDDGTITLWDPQSGKAVQTLTEHRNEDNEVRGLAFSPSGCWLASGSMNENTIILWRREGGGVFGID